MVEIARKQDEAARLRLDHRKRIEIHLKVRRRTAEFEPAFLCGAVEFRHPHVERRAQDSREVEVRDMESGRREAGRPASFDFEIPVSMEE